MSRHFESAPGLCENRDAATEGFVFNQTMLRIKNPEPTRSIAMRWIPGRMIRSSALTKPSAARPCSS